MREKWSEEKEELFNKEVDKWTFENNRRPTLAEEQEIWERMFPELTTKETNETIL